MNEAWFERRPIHLFIDSSCLISMGFDFTHPGFQTIKNGVIAGDLTVISTPILKGEFLKHAAQEIIEDLDKLRRVSALRTVAGDKILDVEKIGKETTAEIIWEKFETTFFPVDIARDVNWQGIFADYFALRPPFTPKKKNEFPDAFNLKMVEALSPTHLVIISSDGDFERWATDRQSTVVYLKLSEFTDSYLKIRDPAFSAAAITGFKTLKDQIVERLQDIYGDDSHYSVTCYHSTIQSAEVKDLTIVSQTLAATNHEDEFAVFQIRARGTAELELDCPVSIYDSEDKKDFFLGSNQKTAEVDVEIEATVTIFVDQDDPEKSDFDISESNIHAEDFEVPHDWVSFLEDHCPDNDPD
jgi:hypothetical protein